MFAVELPGHDLAAEREPFAPIDQVVEPASSPRSHRAGRGADPGDALGPLLRAPRSPWRPPGRCTSAASMSRVFLAAQLLRDAAGRRAAAAGWSGGATPRSPPARPDTRLHRARVSWTRSGPSTSARRTGTTASPRTATSPTCWRPPAAPLSVPVTVVVAADDPSTAEFAHRHRDWQLVAEHVDLDQLPDGVTTSCAPGRPRRPTSCTAPRGCCHPLTTGPLERQDTERYRTCPPTTSARRRCR